METRKNDFSQSQRSTLPRSSETLTSHSFLSSERTAYLRAENQMHKCVNKMVVTDEIWQAGNRVSTEEADGQFCFQMIKLERLKMPCRCHFPGLLAIVLLPSGKNIYIYYDSSVPSLTVLCELQTWMCCPNHSLSRPTPRRVCS